MPEHIGGHGVGRSAPWLSSPGYSRSGHISKRKGAGYILDNVAGTSSAPPEPVLSSDGQNRRSNKRGKIIVLGALATVVVLLAIGALLGFLWRPSGVNFDAVAESCKPIDIDAAIEESGIREQLLTVTSSAGAAGETLTRQVENALARLPNELVHVEVSEDNSSLKISGDTFDVVGLDDNLEDLGAAMVRDAQLFALADCVNGELGFPDAVGQMMRSTNTIAGMQEVKEEEYEVRWTYTLVAGLNAVYAK